MLQQHTQHFEGAREEFRLIYEDMNKIDDARKLNSTASACLRSDVSALVEQVKKLEARCAQRGLVASTNLATGRTHSEQISGLNTI